MAVQRRIGYALKTVSHMVKLSIDKTLSESQSPHITGMQGWIIRYLYHHKDVTDSFQHDLELEFNIRRSTATGLLQRMERDGLIQREPVPYDARCKKIILTQKAINVQEGVMHAIDQVELRILEGLMDTEIDTLFDLLEKIKQNMEAPMNNTALQPEKP